MGGSTAFERPFPPKVPPQGARFSRTGSLSIFRENNTFDYFLIDRWSLADDKFREAKA